MFVLWRNTISTAKGEREDRMPKLNREGRALVLVSAEIKQVFAELDPPNGLIAQLC